MKSNFSLAIKLILSLLFISQLINYSVSPCYAARKRFRKSRKSTTYISRGVVSRVRFRPDRMGLLINFSHFQNLASGRYELVYKTNGIAQAAGGSIIPGDTSTKEVLFGTCSSGICHFNENITNARLSVISVLKDGTTILKPYRIRI